jgi:pimeloyl-ACP methyl ester carboxylesterase
MLLIVPCTLPSAERGFSPLILSTAAHSHADAHGVGAMPAHSGYANAVVLPDYGHMPAVEKQEEVMKLLIEFMEDERGRAL